MHLKTKLFLKHPYQSYFCTFFLLSLLTWIDYVLRFILQLASSLLLFFKLRYICIIFFGYNILFVNQKYKFDNLLVFTCFHLFNMMKTVIYCIHSPIRMSVFSFIALYFSNIYDSRIFNPIKSTYFVSNILHMHRNIAYEIYLHFALVFFYRCFYILFKKYRTLCPIWKYINKYGEIYFPYLSLKQFFIHSEKNNFIACNCKYILQQYSSDVPFI